MSELGAATGSSHTQTMKNPGDSLLEERRIWVGNLDPRLTEFQLLKIVQKCGPIEKFDMLFHKGGPLVGQSRGYAFVTFANSDGALSALEKLNGTLVANRPIAVRLAKNVNNDDLERSKPRIDIPALGSGSRDGRFSKEAAIRAIEAKLKMLERDGDDELQLNTVGSGGGGVGGSGSGSSGSSTQVPFIQRYQFNKDRDGGNNPNQRSTMHRGHTRSIPYNRHQRPKRR